MAVNPSCPTVISTRSYAGTPPSSAGLRIIPPVFPVPSTVLSPPSVLSKRLCNKMQTCESRSKLASCLQEMLAPGRAHLVKDRVVSHLDACVVLLASDDHLYHWLDVVAHELSGFKHLHSDLQGRKPGNRMLACNRDSSLKGHNILLRNIYQGYKGEAQRDGGK